MMLALLIRAKDGEIARKYLKSKGLMDGKRLFINQGNKIQVPVHWIPGKAPFEFEVLDQENPSFKKPTISWEYVKSQMESLLSEEEIAQFKGGWEILGDILIIEPPESLDHKMTMMGEKLLELFPKVRSVVARQGITHELRKPNALVIAGDTGTETTFKEHGTIFRLDPLKVMFSAGNVEERGRMAHISKPGETVLDMFAGIGQLSVPLAKHTMPARVLAIEKNPVTFGYLRENIRLNGLENMEALNGDNRDLAPKDFAHRVLMGYFFKIEEFLPTALNALKNGRGTIHYHDLVPKDELTSHGDAIMGIIEKNGFSAHISYSSIIKSYSPKKWHAVYDIEVGF